jgi:bacterial/archaeal transporter family-2 protein
LENNLDWVALLLAMISGILMAIQGVFNTALSKAIGLVETTFMVNLIGVVILVAPLFVFKMGKINPGITCQSILV